VATLKLHLLGPSGAGKTTLAGQLGQRLGLPVYDLDHIAFTDTHWTIRPRPEKARRVEEILQRQGWIVEGGHLGWTEPLLDAADIIIWLDIPLMTTVSRRDRGLHDKPLPFQLSQTWWQIRWYLRLYQAGQDLDRLPSRAAMRHFLERRSAKVWRYRRNPTAGVIELALRTELKRAT
jgi:GTPase SAR1 family protein